MIELLESTKDTGRRVVPYNTGKVEIGSTWQPKPCPVAAECIERHVPKRSAVAKWVVLSLLALAALVVIARVQA